MNSFENIEFFKPSEFDSPDLPGSGKNMQKSFLIKLDKARKISRVPFFVTHGFRTRYYYSVLLQKGYEAVEDSAHEHGNGADIKYTKSNFNVMLNGFIKAGFKRVGIGKDFFHVDNEDNQRPSPAVWTYKETPICIKSISGSIRNYINEISGVKKKLRHMVSWHY